MQFPRRLVIILASVCNAVYDQELATAYAKLAGAAYCDSDTLISWTCGTKCVSGVHDVKVCNGSSTHAFVGQWTGQCVVSFEGTNGWKSLLKDADAFHASFNHFTVHRGMLHEWLSLSQCVRHSLAKIGCSQQGIGITGHSLGGAVAALAMLDLQVEGWHIVDSYTFGMPRVGYSEFALAFDHMFKGRFFRVTHGRDPFIDLPKGPFYKHVEPEVFYKGNVDQGYIICDSPKEPDNKTCAAQYMPEAQNVLFASSRAWHHTYMGVDTTQNGCRSSLSVGCDDDIPESWCSYAIACNTDVRGNETYCKYGPWYKGGFGRCHCHDGFCPLNGRCVPKKERDMLALLEDLPLQDTGLTPMAFALLFGLIVLSFASVLCFGITRRREQMASLDQQLIPA